jgi:hypothetical protein
VRPSKSPTSVFEQHTGENGGRIWLRNDELDAGVVCATSQIEVSNECAQKFAFARGASRMKFTSTLFHSAVARRAARFGGHCDNTQPKRKGESTTLTD